MCKVIPVISRVRECSLSGLRYDNFITYAIVILINVRDGNVRGV